ncbi:MAG: 1,4-alpha-glucan branching protein GlgB [Verrucomicrobiota bacterium]
MDYIESIQRLVQGSHGSPFDLLGPQATGPEQAGVVIRTFQPNAATVELVEPALQSSRPMRRIHPDGLFELHCPDRNRFSYRLRMTGPDGHVWELDDPYRFPLLITDFDQHLLGEGTHYRTYEKMGAHPVTLEGVHGVHFALWAPNAQRVSVVGDFNHWNGRQHPMQRRGVSGLWELFVPGLQAGDVYKFEVKGHGDFLALKADPYALAAELRPKSASRVWDVRRHTWQDSQWMAQRPLTKWQAQPIAVYEVHLGSWRRVPEENDRWLTYSELADRLIPYVQALGFTHIELLPVSEHPFDGSWGYQPISYFAPSSRFGTPDDFAAFVDRCHQAGIGVILDWVPAHFPRDAHGLGFFDGTHLYEHADPRKGAHMDWGTLIFNYGRNEIRAFLLSNAVYWADVFHIDGLRVDAVASMLYLDYARQAGEWIPNQFGGRENLEAIAFLKKFNEIIHAEFPGFLTFAEESTAWPMVTQPVYAGGLGFDFKWSMGWMHDTLAYFGIDPLYRYHHYHHLTFSLLHAFDENYILPLSHDEVVHLKRSLLGKMPGDDWQKFANLRALYALMYAHPGKKLLFMGAEIAQWGEWNFERSLDWHLLDHAPHRTVQQCVKDLNRLYRTLKPLHEIDGDSAGLEWIVSDDRTNNVFAFLRKSQTTDELILVIANLTPQPLPHYRIGVPRKGFWQEVFNSDAREYGGSGTGNYGGLTATASHSLDLTLPPLATLYFRHQPI